MMKRKEKLVAGLMLGIFFISSITVYGEQVSNTSAVLAPSQMNNPLDNVTIEMITDLESHREDKIPSILPDSSFSVRFNITNYSDQQLLELEMYPETNSFGEIVDNFTSTKSIFAPEESWLTEEYTINIVPGQSIVGEPIDVAIVLDISGSMQDEIDVLKSDLIAVIEELDDTVPDIRIGLVFFGGDNDVPYQNPYNNPSLVHDLTHDVQHIVDILSVTYAAGGYEPWGDALWVSQNHLSWREDAVKLLILITDEPCDSGVIIGDGQIVEVPNQMIDYDGPLLYELYSNLSEEGFIICSIVASTFNELTAEQLHSAAMLTGGTYIRLGQGDLQTDDLPEIVGELVEQYAAELDLKVSAVLSHFNSSDVREYTTRTFTVLIDDLPPEISFWVFTSEDLYTDTKYLNIDCRVKDVSGVAYVEIYYKMEEDGFWIIANASKVGNDEYLLSIPYDVFTTEIFYQIYTQDWLGNDVTSDIQGVHISEIDEYTTLTLGKRSEITLLPEQSTMMKIVGHPTEDSFLVVLSEDLDDTFDIVVLDLNESAIVQSKSACYSIGVNLTAGHVLKIQLYSKEYTGVVICNQKTESIEFARERKMDLDYDGVILLEIDNRFSDGRSRSILADSQSVQTRICVFNSSTWELLLSGYSEVILPNEECYVLVYPVYHYGEINVSYNFEELNEPFEHYYAAEAMPFAWSFIPLCLIALAYILKRKRV